MPITDVPPSPPPSPTSSSSPSASPGSHPEALPDQDSSESLASNGHPPEPRLTRPESGEPGDEVHSTSEQKPKRRKRGDYTDLEHHELLLVIDDLEDERSRLRRREGIWVSVLAHIVIFLVLAFLPRFIPQVRVVNPSDDIKEHQRDLTHLTLPPDALKGLRQQVPKAAPAPAPSPKTLEAPPAPTPAPPAPPKQQQAQQQAPPKQVQQAAQPAPAPPMATAPQSQMEAPRPTKPTFSDGQAAPGEAVRDAARAAAKSGVQAGGGGSLGAPGRGQAAGLQGGAQVLTDTGGWDFNPYIRRVVYDTKQAWYPIIPEEVRPPLLKKGVVGIRFKIYRDGSVHDLTLEGRSGDVSLDKAAWGGITGASPYPPLPPEFKGPFLELRFGFFYNQDPGLQ